MLNSFQALRFIRPEGTCTRSLMLHRIVLAVMRAGLLILLWANFQPISSAATLSASLDRDSTLVGEPLTLSLVFEGGTPSVAPAIPAPRGLSITFAGQSRRVEIVNGRTASYLVLEYSLVSSQPGDFVIPPITIAVGAGTLETKPISFKVLKSTDSGGSNDPYRKWAFLKLQIPKNEIYSGEVIPVEVRLYVKDAEDVQMPQLKGEGFTIGKMAKPVQTRTMVGNQPFNLVTFKSSVIPVKGGKLTLGPFEIPMVLRIPQSTRRQRDPNDPFGSDLFEGFFGNRVERRRVTLTTEPETVTVMDLPTQGRPEDFSGVVGSYSFVATASPTQLTIGDPVTLKVQVAGRGAFEQLNLPGFSGDSWKQFKSYTPTSRVETTDELGLEGIKSFEQVLIPENPGIKAVPEIRFSFFDPESREYRTLVHPPIPLTLTASTQAAAQPTVVAAPQATNGTGKSRPVDIVHIKLNPGPFVAMTAPWIENRFFWLIQALPLLLWGGAYGWRRRCDSIAGNPRLRRRIEVDRKISTGLELLRQQSRNTQDSTEFFQTAFRLIQERLGERLDLPAASITESVVEEYLRSKGLPEARCLELEDIFRACDQARYAKVGGAGELGRLLQQMEQVLEELRRWEPTTK